MVAPAQPRPTDLPRRLFVVDEAGSQVAEFTQDPIDGGLKFGNAHFDRVLLTVNVVSDGYLVTTFDAAGLPHTFVSVSSDGKTEVERIDLRDEGNGQ
jgi:hypothetical protein